jgi:hypothetical protein
MVELIQCYKEAEVGGLSKTALIEAGLIHIRH